jgi:hypothetical protein
MYLQDIVVEINLQALSLLFTYFLMAIWFLHNFADLCE